MERNHSPKRSDIGSIRDKSGEKIVGNASFLYKPDHEQASLVIKGQEEVTKQFHDEQKKRQIEQIDDVENLKESLIARGKRFYEEIQKESSSLEEMQKKRGNYERRYDTKIAETLYEDPPYNMKTSKEVSPSAYTVETRVKGHPRACYWNSINLEKGIVWGDGNYKAPRDKLASIESILVHSKDLEQAKGEKLKNISNDILKASYNQKLSERIEGAENLLKAINDVNLALQDSDVKKVKISLRKIIDLAQEKKDRQNQRAREGKYDKEAEPFEIDEAGKNVPVQGTEPSFNSEVIAYQIDHLMKAKDFQPENFVLREFHGLDTVHTESVRILKLFVEKNSTKAFKKENDRFFALLTAPTIKKTVRMAIQHFPNVELSEIVLARGDSDRKIHRTICRFELKASSTKPT
jgi:hypothetical protein